MAALHFGAEWSGFYDWQYSTRVFWFDKVLHLLVGVGFAMAALWWAELRRTTPLATVALVLMLVLAGAIVWEAAEYIFFTQFTDYSYWSRIYVPSASAAVGDILADLAGASLFLALLWRRLWAVHG